MMKQVNIRNPFRMFVLMLGLFLSVGAFAQIDVKGHVKDAQGESVIGATVRVVGTQTATVTDFDGNFALKANQGADISVTYVGYKEAIVKAAANLEITLQEDANVLENVVVIGYGRAKKSDLTGSVTAIKPDEMNHGLQTTAQDMLQGKIAGVNITNSGGEPGAGATIRIRGGSSLNASNNPLIVIDGLSMDSYGVQGLSNPLSLVNPNDIESFTVLKDASATAIYGSRASNGVIIITTKKGRKGQKPQISYSGNVSVSAVKKKMDVMNSSEYIDFAKQLVVAQKGYTDEQWLASPEYASLGYTDANGNHVMANTDWQDEIYRTAVSTDHNITISGGIKNVPYRVSLGYTDQNGIVKTSNYQRYTASISLSPSLLNDHLNLNINAKGMYSKTKYANAGTAIGSAIFMDPTKPVYDPAGDNNGFGGYWQWGSTADWGDTEWTKNINTYATGNPVAALNNYCNEGKAKVLMGNFEADYKIHGFEDLHLHMNAGMEITDGKTNQYQSPYSYASGTYYYSNQGWNKQDSYNLSLTLYAQYMKDFAEKHHFDIMAGYEWQHFHNKTDYFYYGLYPSTTTKTDDNGNSLAGTYYLPSENTLYKTENYLVSFFGRMNYSLLDRYMVTFTLRNDGSSRFSKDKRWGVFPSVALAWKINEEPILKDAKWLSDMKLRLGWGITGQQEGIGDYTYIATYTPNSQGAYYKLFGDGRTYRPDAYNPELTWEKTTTWNVGLDFGILNDRLTFNLDWYYRKTKDLINSVVIPVGTNFANKVNTNIGSLHNTGFELAANWRAIQTRDWSWQIGYNFTWNKNEIDKLVAGSNDDYKILHGGLAIGDSGSNGVKCWQVGHSVDAYYVYQQVYDANGEPIDGQFVDRNADGIINDKDRYFYKKSTPDVTMGLTSKVTWKNWDFGFSLRASLNNYVYNGIEAGNSNLSLSQVYLGNAWHNVIGIARDKNWKTAEIQGALSDYYIQNASFLKCDNITLGYSFDNLFGLKANGRIYATAQNVFTITKYKGLDPEIDGGYDGNMYPRPFVGILGLTLNF